ncbi:glycosyltransferase family 2 protein [Companilactobacillus jidongensis]|uniref:glycosyltransferase family 2 protein n=1 Tax=Companilactobacillus jidongensis TaxID=2486006 RepID=UPI000F793550|nr:glycosyltransferase family A protein [Companilactobacillus jidongensis]
MDKLLSIVVPSYNAEKFLDNVLGHLVKCKMLNRLDILIVDDGSTDKTADIGNDYATKYPDSIRLISKENGGYGSTVNAGIINAHGRYFKVVDADDWLDPKNLDRFIGLLKRTDVDLILTPFWAFNDKSKHKHVAAIRPDDIKWGQKYYLKEQGIDPVPSMHTYTLRTKLLQENSIRLDEHAFYVDIEYILFPIPYVKTFEFINMPLYNYRVNQAVQSISLTNMRKNQQQHSFVVDRVNSYIHEHTDGLNDNQRELMVNRLSRMIATQLKIISLSPIRLETKRELSNFYSKVKDEYYFEVNDVNLPMRWLIKSRFYLFPVIHYLAILKMQLVHY